LRITGKILEIPMLKLENKYLGQEGKKERIGYQKIAGNLLMREEN